MNKKLIDLLQRIFWILGWFLLVGAVASVGVRTYMAFYGQELFKFSQAAQHFNLIGELKELFGYLGQAYFSFLVSAIFGMIGQRQSPISERTERFLILTCIGFCAQGTMSLIGWVTALPMMMSFNFQGVSDYVNYFSAGAYLFSVVASLIPFVYATTVYVLYKHFAQLITFESEVI